MAERAPRRERRARRSRQAWVEARAGFEVFEPGILTEGVGERRRVPEPRAARKMAR